MAGDFYHYILKKKRGTTKGKHAFSLNRRDVFWVFLGKGRPIRRGMGGRSLRFSSFLGGCQRSLNTVKRFFRGKRESFETFIGKLPYPDGEVSGSFYVKEAQKSPP